MTNENKKIPYTPFDAPLHFRELDIPIPDWLEEEIKKVDLPDIACPSFDASTASPTSASDATESSNTTASSNVSPKDSNSSASFDASTASPTSASDATESSNTTASSNVSPKDSNSSASFDASTASPTSASDATESSNTTASSNVSPKDSNSSASFDASTASPTSASDATESSNTTASSNVSPKDSNSSASFDASTASPTSASDATESSNTTASSNVSPNDSIPNSSTSNEPEEETILHFGRKMTWEQIQDLSNNPKLRDQFEKSSKIYYEMKQSPSSTYSFFESKRRKQCRKVPVPELDSESIFLYEPIAAHMRSQNLFENELVLDHFQDPIYVMFVNWFFEVLGFIGTPPLLFGNTNLSKADFIGILRLTFSITKVQDYRKHHTFVEFMKLVESLALTTGANIAWVSQDGDPFGKNGLWSSWFTDKILELDPGLKELVDFYYKIVELYQKCALPISTRIIKNRIQKNNVSGNKEKKETENLGEKGVKYFMVDAQSGKYLKYFPDCCKQASAVYMHSFKNGNAFMKMIKSYHFSVQNNGYDGKADGLMTLGLFHRAYFVYLSILSIIHRQDFNETFVNENGKFDFKKLLKKSGVAGVKGRKPALMSKDTDICYREVRSNTIESCSLEMFVRETGISYEELYSEFANPFTYKRDVQELRGYDVSLNRSSLEKYNTFRGVSEMKSGKFRCEIYLQENKFYLGTHPSEFIAAYVHDQALNLSGIRNVTLNFESQEDNEETLDVVIKAELDRKQESMSKEEWAEFDQNRFIEEYTESIPSDTVIKGVVVGGLSWTDSLKNGASTGGTVATKKLKKINEFIGVQKNKKNFQCAITHNGTYFHLGNHSSGFIAACVYDKAATLLGRKKLNFKSDKDFKEKLQVVTAAELIKKQESMSKVEWAMFDQNRFIEEYTESIPSDAVIKRVVVDRISWTDSLKGITVATKKVKKTTEFIGVSPLKDKGFKCAITHNGTYFHLGNHSSGFIAACVYDKAATLLGRKKLNFKSDKDFKEKLQVVTAAELIKKQESMSKVEWAMFDQNRFIEEYTESIPSDAVIKRVVVDRISWTDSLKGITVATKKVKKTTEFIGVSPLKDKGFKCEFTHNGTYYYLGYHSSEFIAACVYDKAATLLGRKKLNFKSDKDFKEKLQVVTAAELIKKQESMSKEAWAMFDQNRFIEEYTESIPSDAVIKRVVVDRISWTDSLKGITVATKKLKKTTELVDQKPWVVVKKAERERKSRKHKLSSVDGPIEEKKSKKRQKDKDLLGHKKKEEEEKQQEWVQCEKCEKWHRLPCHIAAKDLPDKWFCSMNDWDPRSASCTVQEDYKVEDEKIDDNAIVSTSKEEEEKQQEWVQCEKCEKWHRLPCHIAAKDLPDKWFCSMNDWDPRSVSCIVQEDYKVEDEKIDDNAIVSTSRNEKGASVVQT